jgi:hypothetical protein
MHAVKWIFALSLNYFAFVKVTVWDEETIPLIDVRPHASGGHATSPVGLTERRLFTTKKMIIDQCTSDLHCTP